MGGPFGFSEGYPVSNVCLKQSTIGQGGFETEFTVGTEYSIALANGTVALDLALKALNVSRGQNAAFYTAPNAGAIPICRHRAISTSETIRPLITNKTKGLSRSSLLANMDPPRISQSHNLFLIEDCAQAWRVI